MKKPMISRQFSTEKNDTALLFFIIITCALFSVSCTKIPEKYDVEEIINSSYEHPPELCGNGKLDPFEECDFSGHKKCSDYDSAFVGRIACTDCKLNRSGCFDQHFCDETYCLSKGICRENKVDYTVYCDCFGRWSGEKCDECKNGNHFDFDGECLSNMGKCTFVGCPYENETCRIVDGKSACFCEEPYTGEKCDKCISTYYLEDGKCLSRSCHDSNISCSVNYESCDDSSGKPVCLCHTETQNPENCKECLPDYVWDNGNKCINEKIVRCISDPEALENSVDIISEYNKISFSDKNGWEDPPYCKWRCDTAYYLNAGKCDPTLIGTSDSLIEFPIGVDNKGVFYAGNRSGNVFSLSKSSSRLLYSMGVSTSNGRMGHGNNIYFGTSNGYSIVDTESWAHLTLSKTGFPASGKMTVLKNGKVSFGHSYISGIDYHRVDNNLYSTIVSDQNGNMLSIDRLSATFFDEDFNIIWNKQYENIIFGEYPVISKDDFSYIPCCHESNSSICVIDTYTGELEKTIGLDTVCENSIWYYPSVAIDNDNNLFVLSRGVLYSFDASRNPVFKTDNTIFSGNRSMATVTPVITDSGNIYFSNDKKVICSDKDGNLVWYYELSNIPEYMFHYDGILYVFANNRTMSKFYAPGNLSGEWPMFQKDYKLSGSLAEIDSTDKPSKPVIVTPINNKLIKDSTALLSWNNSNKNLDHVVTIKKGNLDEILDGPSSIFSHTLDDMKIGDITWKVASISPDGGVSIVSSNFSITSALEIWRFKSDKKFIAAPITVNYDDEIVAGRTDDLVFISTKNNTHKSFKINTANFKGTATNKKGVFFGFAENDYFEIDKGKYYSETLLKNDSSFLLPAINECNDQMITLYKDEWMVFFKSDIFDTPKFISNFSFSFGNPVANNLGQILLSGKLMNLWGAVFKDIPCDPNALFEDYFLCGNSNSSASKAFLINEELGFEIFPIISGTTAPVVNNGEFYSVAYIDSKCQIRASVPGENVESRIIYEWRCYYSDRPRKLVVSSDGTFFTFADKNILAIREGEGFILNKQVSDDEILDITLTENGRLFVLTESKIFEIEHDAAGANPYEWSQYRGNSRRTGSLNRENCNTPPLVELKKPINGEKVKRYSKNNLFEWEAYDAEGDNIVFDIKIYSKTSYKTMFEEKNIEDSFFLLPLSVAMSLAHNATYYWVITAKDGNGGFSTKESFFKVEN